MARTTAKKRMAHPNALIAVARRAMKLLKAEVRSTCRKSALKWQFMVQVAPKQSSGQARAAAVCAAPRGAVWITVEPDKIAVSYASLYRYDFPSSWAAVMYACGIVESMQ